jgi:hypothetical protein
MQLPRIVAMESYRAIARASVLLGALVGCTAASGSRAGPDQSCDPQTDVTCPGNDSSGGTGNNSAQNNGSSKGGSRPGSGSSGSGVDAGRDSAVQPLTTVDASTPLPTGQCGASTTGAACFACCQSAHSSGFNTWDQALGQCVCDPSNCLNACSSSACGGGVAAQSGDVCDQCMNAVANQCNAFADSQCQAAGGDCGALLTCAAQSACGNKP